MCNEIDKCHLNLLDTKLIGAGSILKARKALEKERHTKTRYL